MTSGPQTPADSLSAVGAEVSSHAFVIRLWLEEAAEHDRRQLWRGHITHVPGGERRYLLHLEDVVAFMTVYLRDAELGARAGMLYRAWLGLTGSRRRTPDRR